MKSPHQAGGFGEPGFLRRDGPAVSTAQLQAVSLPAPSRSLFSAQAPSMATVGFPLVTVAGPPGVRQLSPWHSLGYMTARLGRGGHLCGGGSPSRHLLFRNQSGHVRDSQSRWNRGEIFFQENIYLLLLPT